MPVDQQQLFTALLADSDFAVKLKSTQLSLHLVQHDPRLSLYVSSDGVTTDASPTPATFRLESSGETAQQIWAGQLPLMVAVIGRRLRVKGPISRLRQFAELLPAVGAKHAELSE